MIVPSVSHPRVQRSGAPLKEQLTVLADIAGRPNDD